MASTLTVARHAHHCREHEQRAHHGYNGAYDGNKHRRGLGDAEAGGHGIGNESVRGVHGAEQKRGSPVEMQQEHRAEHAEHKRNHKREHAEKHASAEVEPQMVYVYLQPRKEHEVEQTHLPENGEARIVVEHIEAIGTHYHAGHYHAHDVRNLKPREQQRRQQDDDEHHREYGYGLCDERRGRHGGESAEQAFVKKMIYRWSIT